MACLNIDPPYRALLPTFHRVLVHGHPADPSWNVMAFTLPTERTGYPWYKVSPPGGPQGTGWSDLWMILVFWQSNILWKVYIVKSDKYGISNPVLLSCQDHFNGVSLQYTPNGEILQAALEVTMKSKDIFNIKPGCLLLLLLFFKLRFAEYLKNVYIKKRSWWLTSGWFPFAVGVYYLVLTVNVLDHLTP